jgi:HSP20 family protein
MQSSSALTLCPPSVLPSQVSGQRKLEHQEKDADGKVWRSERAAFSFSRAFELPPNARAEGISASMDKGVLTVTVPKRDPPAKPEPKRIAVTGTGEAAALPSAAAPADAGTSA